MLSELVVRNRHFPCPSIAFQTGDHVLSCVIFISAFEGCCAQEEALTVGKPDLDVAQRQCAGSPLVPHLQLSGTTSDIRCAPSTLFSGLSFSRLFPVFQT
jgi:hypothetical protein